MKYTVLLLLLITILYIPLVLIDYHHFPYSDGAEHGAAVRELARDLISPGEPMLSEYVGKSPRYVPSVLLMAAAVRLTGIDVLTAIKLFAVLFFLFFLISVVFFAREYFQDPGQVVWALVCMLFLWGTGWTGANAYMFSALVHTAWYPSLVSFSCVLMALAFACRFLRSGHTPSLPAWCLFGAMAFANHPPTGIFLWIASALLVAELKGIKTLCWLWYAFSIIIAVGAATMWPYYDFLSSFLKVSAGTMAQTWDYLLSRKYLYSDIALRTGPALVAIPVVVLYLIKKKYPALTLFCLLSAGIYATGYFLHISLAERFIFAAMLSGQLLFARYASALFHAVRQGTASTLLTACAGLLGVLMVVGIATQGVLIYQEYLRPNFRIVPVAPFVRYKDPTAMHKQFALHMGEGDVVLSDFFTSWGIPLYTGARIVSLLHTPTHVLDNELRKIEANRFYDPSVSNQERISTLRRYGITKIIIHFLATGDEILDQLKALGLPVIVCNEVFCLFDVPAEKK